MTASSLPASEIALREPADEAILDAALEQFCLIGIRRTSAEDIARRAGVNRTTLYRRIGPMDALIDAVLMREFQRLRATVQDTIAPIDNPAERFTEALVTTIGWIRAHPLLERVLTVDRDDVLPRVTLDGAPLLDLAVAFVADQIEQGYAALGLTPEIDVIAVAEILVRLIHSFVLTPEVRLRLRTEEQLREFARTHLLPLVILR